MLAEKNDIVKSPDSTVEDDRLIDVFEVAKLLSISERSAWKLKYSGKLPSCVQVLRLVRWRLSDIQRFIAVGCDMEKYSSACQSSGGDYARN